MSGPDYVIVSFDDWQALYCNGEKVMEGHRLSTREVLEEMDVLCKFIQASSEIDEQVSEIGCVPNSLSELLDGPPS